MTIASADDSGRIMAVKLQTDHSQRISATIILDVRLDIRKDGAIRQLLLDHRGTKLLVSAQETDQTFDLIRGNAVQCYDGLASLGGQFWMIHPLDSSKLIHFSITRLHIYSWEEFERLSPSDGLNMIQQTGSTAEVVPDQVQISHNRRTHSWFDVHEERHDGRGDKHEP